MQFVTNRSTYLFVTVICLLPKYNIKTYNRFLLLNVWLQLQKYEFYIMKFHITAKRQELLHALLNQLFSWFHWIYGKSTSVLVEFSDDSLVIRTVWLRPPFWGRDTILTSQAPNRLLHFCSCYMHSSCGPFVFHHSRYRWTFLNGVLSEIEK